MKKNDFTLQDVLKSIQELVESGKETTRQMEKSEGNNLKLLHTPEHKSH